MDTGAGKSFISKTHYYRCKSLHSLPEITSKTQRIQVGNGHYVKLLFIMLVIINIHSHILGIFTLVSNIHEEVDLVIGIKNIFELESIINSR